MSSNPLSALMMYMILFGRTPIDDGPLNRLRNAGPSAVHNENGGQPLHFSHGRNSWIHDPVEDVSLLHLGD